MSQYSMNFLLVPIPEYPLLECAPNKVIKLVVLGGSGVGKTGKCPGSSPLPSALPHKKGFAFLPSLLRSLLSTRCAFSRFSVNV